RLDTRLNPVAAHTFEDAPTGTVVDIGGGSARSRQMWPAEWTYYSIDPDSRLLEVESTDKPIERLVGDAASLPLPDNSADVVLMQCVSHHLDDSIWPVSLSEANRVLKPGGSFIFVDGVWTKRRWLSRVFWKLDAGHYPRTSEQLESAINDKFCVLDTERFALVHHSLIITAKPLSD
ncbi:MAG: methyltransferase domain-containing protein, partial [Actinobacteria bacterium]|nr:methyltransferase domain-containing protein [Actinomycetota bacterium]